MTNLQGGGRRRPAADVAAVAAAAARSVPEVVGLSAGSVGEVATHGAGRRVDGVRVRPGHPGHPADIDVHIVVRYPSANLLEVAGRVHEAVEDALARSAATDAVVHVRIADIDDPSSSRSEGA